MELDTEQRQALRDGLSGIVDRTRRFLPDEYVVDSRVASDSDGLYAAVAVEPPIGNAVSARFAPEFEDEADTALAETDRDELARNLAASAALQAKTAVSDPPQTAR